MRSDKRAYSLGAFIGGESVMLDSLDRHQAEAFMEVINEAAKYLNEKYGVSAKGGGLVPSWDLKDMLKVRETHIAEIARMNKEVAAYRESKPVAFMAKCELGSRAISESPEAAIASVMTGRSLGRHVITVTELIERPAGGGS